MVAAPSADALPAFAAVASTASAAGVAFAASTGARFVNGAAYGSERRFPLRAPTALLLGPVPVAGLCAAVGPFAGPLLLADGRPAGGLALTAVGWPLAAASARSLYALSQRWAILVPAGIVLKDPLTLVDPVLFLRDKVAGLRPLPFPAAPADDVVDLRLGVLRGSLVLELAEEAAVLCARGRRRGGEMVNARRIAFSPVDQGGLLEDAGRRRIVAAG